ncbi:MAG: hypothetical protein ABIG64_03265 [Candidatus Omnitrophota bacterium]
MIASLGSFIKKTGKYIIAARGGYIPESMGPAKKYGYNLYPYKGESAQAKRAPFQRKNGALKIFNSINTQEKISAVILAAKTNLSNKLVLNNLNKIVIKQKINKKNK